MQCFFFCVFGTQGPILGPLGPFGPIWGPWHLYCPGGPSKKIVTRLGYVCVAFLFPGFYNFLDSRNQAGGLTKLCDHLPTPPTHHPSPHVPTRQARAPRTRGRVIRYILIYRAIKSPKHKWSGNWKSIKDNL